MASAEEHLRIDMGAVIAGQLLQIAVLKGERDTLKEETQRLARALDAEREARLERASERDDHLSS
jgi:hypothetical protein